MTSFLSFLKPAPYQPLIKDQDVINQDYRHWRLRILYSLFFGYAIFYFTRKSYTFIMPYLAQDLNLSYTQLGFLSSILYITYGISKFLSGVQADRSNPRYFMAIGLMMTGVFNILFAFSSSLWFFALFWGLNGWFQAWGWPACCKQLNYWYAKSERGLWYGICSTSHNLGGALIPILAVYLALQFNWRVAMLVPAGISIIMGLILIERLRDVPRTLGLPSVEIYRKEKTECESDSLTEHSLLSVKDILFKQVLTNKLVWIMSISYFFVYVVRIAVNDWIFMYLTEEKSVDAYLASWAVSAFEVGGFVGMIIAGWSSDYIWKGNRVPSMVICALGMVFSTLGLWYLPAHYVYLDLVLLALIGAFVFGPQMIVGLAAAEFVDKRAVSASNGFTGTIGYFGAACAGMPIGFMLDEWGWNGFFLTMLASSLVIFLILLPLWSAGGKYNTQAARLNTSPGVKPKEA